MVGRTLPLALREDACGSGHGPVCLLCSLPSLLGSCGRGFALFSQDPGSVTPQSLCPIFPALVSLVSTHPSFTPFAGVSSWQFSLETGLDVGLRQSTTRGSLVHF